MIDFKLKRKQTDTAVNVQECENDVVIEDVTIKGAYVIVDNGYLR